MICLKNGSLGVEQHSNPLYYNIYGFIILYGFGVHIHYNRYNNLDTT